MGILDGKKGLITGIISNSSMATEIARQVVNEGGKIVITSLPDQMARVKRVAEKEGLNPELIVPMDVSSEEQMKDAVDATAKTFGGSFDFLLHSIGFLAKPKERIVDIDWETFTSGMRISSFSLARLAHYARPYMNYEGRGGSDPEELGTSSIVALTYLGGERYVPGYNAMGVIKGALEHTGRILACELGGEGIRVNLLSPGPMKTPAGVGVGVKAFFPLYEECAPLRRNTTHTEVGKIGAYFLSPYSSPITGDTVHIDGGFHLTTPTLPEQRQ